MSLVTDPRYPRYFREQSQLRDTKDRGSSNSTDSRAPVKHIVQVSYFRDSRIQGTPVHMVLRYTRDHKFLAPGDRRDPSHSR